MNSGFHPYSEGDDDLDFVDDYPPRDNSSYSLLPKSRSKPSVFSPAHNAPHLVAKSSSSTVSYFVKVLKHLQSIEHIYSKNENLQIIVSQFQKKIQKISDELCDFSEEEQNCLLSETKLRDSFDIKKEILTIGSLLLNLYRRRFDLLKSLSEGTNKEALDLLLEGQRNIKFCIDALHNIQSHSVEPDLTDKIVFQKPQIIQPSTLSAEKNPDKPKAFTRTEKTPLNLDLLTEENHSVKTQDK